MSIQPSSASLPPPANPVLSAAPRVARAPVENASDYVDPSQSVRGNQQSPQLDRNKLEAAAQSVREFVEPINSNLEFRVNEETGDMVVRIVDRATKEIIRQIPSEEMLALAKALDSIKGLFVKQTA